MTFEKWWEDHPIAKSDAQAGLKIALRECAEQSWNAALRHAAGVCREPEPECCGNIDSGNYDRPPECCGKWEPRPKDADECARAIEQEIRQ